MAGNSIFTTVTNPPLLIAVWLAIWLLPCPIQAQSLIDTTQLNTVTVTEHHGIAPSGFKVQQVDSFTMVAKLTGSLADVLQNETAIYLKNYGLGSLTTVSFRGMGANHTRISWNDLPINSSMNGTIDLTTLPTALFSTADIQYGNASLFIGSGGIGGGIQLQSLPEWNNKYHLNFTQSIGSFGTYKTALRMEVGNSHWQSITGFIINKADNNFSFRNTALFNSPVQEQQNAHFLQLGGIQEVYGRLQRGHELAFRAWITWSDRQIPPTMISSNSLEGQKDVLIFGNAEWKWHKGIHYFRSDIDYKFDKIRYINQVAMIDNSDYTHTIDHVFTYQSFPISQLSISARLENQEQIALTPNFNGGNKNQWLNGLYAGIKYMPFKQLDLTLGLREEVLDVKASPFLPSLAINYLPNERLGIKLYANVYRNYLYPTLNDRYWYQGGNPNLQQERAFGTEGGIAINKWVAKNRVRVEANATAYTMWVDNWIVWLPVNAEVWSPRNVMKVWSRGIEARAKLTACINSWLVLFTTNYQYNNATVQQSVTPNDPSVGRTLIYTPQQTGNISARVDYKGWHLTYTQQFVGQRYTTSDNSNSLGAFTTGDLTIGKNIRLKVPGLGIYVTASNLWNTAYQNIAWRAMPGRAFTVGIHYNLEQKLNKPEK